MLRRGGIGVVCAAVCIDMFGFGIVLPLIPFYAEELGASPRWVTGIIAAFPAMQLLAAPIWGRVSDRVGRRPLLVIGLFLSAISYLVFAFADDLITLLLSRAAAGAAGGTISVAQAYVADVTEGEDRARGFGLIGAASGLGVMLGPVVGGFAGRAFGLGAPGFVAAGLCFLNALGAIVFLPAPDRKNIGVIPKAASRTAALREWAQSLTQYPLTVMFLVYFLTIICFTSMTSVLALYGERQFAMEAVHMGWVFTVAGAVTIIVRGRLVGGIVERFGEAALVRAGAAVLGIGVVAIPLLTARWQLWFTVPVWAFGTGILFPSLHALISRATDAHSQGSILGGSQLAGGAGRVMGPLVAGWLFQSWAIESPFFVAAFFALLAVLVASKLPTPATPDDPERAAVDRWNMSAEALQGGDSPARGLAPTDR